MSESQPPAPILPDPSRAVERVREIFTPLLVQLTLEVEPITTYNPTANSSLLPAAEKQHS
jgi:hypothetical protein